MQKYSAVGVVQMKYCSAEIQCSGSSKNMSVGGRCQLLESSFPHSGKAVVAKENYSSLNLKSLNTVL